MINASVTITTAVAGRILLLPKSGTGTTQDIPREGGE